MRRRIPIGLTSVSVLVASGALASGVGAITCHEEVGSSDQAPHLCAAVGGGAGLVLTWLTPPTVIALLTFTRPRGRVIGYAAFAAVCAQAALFTMWALVAHGTLTY